MTCRIQHAGTPTRPFHHGHAGRVPNGSTLSREQQTSAEDLFEQFCAASTLKNIATLFNRLCECVKLRPNDYRTFYTRLTELMSFSWKWKNFQHKMDKRAGQREYGQGKICQGHKVLIVGAGPCGLRMAIEAALLGAKVVVVEKRDRFSRNNVLHLWPFVITDLLNLGAKKFYPKFCSGNVDHISIRILQCILLKIALLLGVEFHYGVGFVNYLEPPDSDECTGWRAQVHPPDHHVASYEFDVLIGADGRRNTLQGFQRKVFRGMLAIAITANFINRNTPEEHRVEEISGVARIYNQQFFKELHDDCGIDLENIVYYRDATHYFVMTAKKASLLAKGVLKQDFLEVERLLDRSNIDRTALTSYALEAAKFSTKKQLPQYEFAINFHKEPDVSVFDFTNMYAAENACRIVERRGHKLLINLVGDSLIEPFWPLGTGCAHGFLGVFDAAWMLRHWGLADRTPLQMIVERETIYRSLSSINAEHLLKNMAAYTIDPISHYVHIDLSKAKIFMVRHLLDTDCPENVDKSELPDSVHWRRAAVTGHTPKQRLRRDTVSEAVLMEWCASRLQSYGLHVPSVNAFWAQPLPLCALIHHFRPELIEDYYSLDAMNEEKTWNRILTICREQLGIEVPFTSSQLQGDRENIDCNLLFYILLQFYESFKREIPGEFVPQISMDSSPSLDQDVPRRPPRKTPASPGSSSPSSSKRRQIPGQEPSKRRRPSKPSDLATSLSHKRRSSMDQINVNMGEKIKLLEQAFTYQPRPASAAAPYHSSDNLAEKKEFLEQKLRGGSLQENYTEKEKYNGALMEQVRSELREKGVKGLEGRYPPELVKLVVFQDKKREMMLKLSGDTGQSKFAAIDEQLARADQQLRDGSALSRAPNTVSTMADDYRTVVHIAPPSTVQPAKKSPTSPHNLKGFQASNNECYFCQQRVYLAERKCLEGLFFHRPCFKCEHCKKLLALNGEYQFDRYDPSGAKFYCPAHFKYRKHDYTPLQSPEKPSPSLPPASPQKSPLFSFTRYPSREDVLCASPAPSVSSSRYLDDDSDEGELDEEKLLTHNFGGTTVPGAGASSDSEEMEKVIDGEEAEIEVEAWRRKRAGKVSEGGSTDSSSWESGEIVHNAYEDSSEPLHHPDSTSPDESDADTPYPPTAIKAPPSPIPPAKPLTTPLPPPGNPVPNDLHPLPTDYRKSPLTSVRSDDSDAFFTPKHSLSPQPTFPMKKVEVKWDQTVLETSRRLRELRMGGRDTPSRTGCDSADEVFVTPRTSFCERDGEAGRSEGGGEAGNGFYRYYGGNLIPADSPGLSVIVTDEPINRQLDFPSTPPTSPASTVKQRLLSATQERKAEARARAKLKSDEELSRSCRLRGSSSSERSDGGRAPGARVLVEGAGKGVLRVVDASSSSDDADAYFTRRTKEIAEKNYKQETTKIVHRAQEIQRLIEETQVRLRELDEKAADIERALKGDVHVNNSDQQLQTDWFSLLEEKQSADRQLQELKLTAEKLELEDRHRRGQEQLRHLMAIEDNYKSQQDKEREEQLMSEMLDIRTAKNINLKKLTALQK